MLFKRVQYQFVVQVLLSFVASTIFAAVPFAAVPLVAVGEGVSGVTGVTGVACVAGADNSTGFNAPADSFSSAEERVVEVMDGGRQAPAGNDFG